MTEAVARLRRILELERAKKCTDSVVMGGLDGYLQRFLEEMRLPDGHRLREFMGRLPPGGYRVLHPVQRRTVVKELLSALNSVPASAVPAPPPVKRDPPQKARVIGTLDSPVTVLKGISRYYAGKFARIGASTVGDLLFHFPHRYNDFASVRPIGQLVIGDEQTVIATVWEASETSVGRRKATQAFVGDDTGTLRILWWGNVYVARQLRSGMKLALSGRVTVFRGRRQMENPEWEPVTEGSLHTRRLVPVYPSTEALPQRLIRSAARQAVDAFAERVDDPLPPALRSRLGLPPAPEAIRQFHFPDDRSLADAARRRFAFEELLLIELGVVKRRLLWQAGSKAPRLSLPDDAFEGFVASLPFALTQAQRRAAGEIMADMARDVPMSRLLEGD
ncbi:MAG: DNA helicase RecG, partial [Chloroflexi bacterium]|nr:DNA helicase RecG [Chloroflexota bacterium]